MGENNEIKFDELQEQITMLEIKYYELQVLVEELKNNLAIMNIELNSINK